MTRPLPPSAILSREESERMLTDALALHNERLADLAQRVRDTANDLRAGMHPHHAANRLMNIAAELHAPAKKETT